MSNVITLPCITTHNLPAERVLNGALEADLAGVVVLGYDKEGKPYFASSYADGGDVMWLMELLKRELLNTADAIARGEITR